MLISNISKPICLDFIKSNKYPTTMQKKKCVSADSQSVRSPPHPFTAFLKERIIISVIICEVNNTAVTD